MPLPLLIGGLGALAAVTGIGTSIKGTVQINNANELLKLAKEKQDVAINKFEKANSNAIQIMDDIGEMELSILNSFEQFSDYLEKIQGRPEFKHYNIESIDLPIYSSDEIKDASSGANILITGLGSTAIGVASSYAAAGATNSAMAALKFTKVGASIGKAAAGGSTLGVGLLVGGIINRLLGDKLSTKANEAYQQSLQAEEEVKKICNYLSNLSTAATKFRISLNKINTKYLGHLSKLDEIVSHKTEWSKFTDAEKLLTENTILLVGLLYKMCQTNLVRNEEDDNAFNKVNREGINHSVDVAKTVTERMRTMY